MLKSLRRANQKRATRKVLDRARGQGLTPPEVFALALQAECGFPQFPGEPISDFAARAAGVSRERFDKYRAVIESGAHPPAEFRELNEFMNRVGMRLVWVTRGNPPQKGTNHAESNHA